MSQGRVQEVHLRNVGDELAADAAAGATALILTDVSDFNDSGGQLRLNSVVYFYTGRDDDLNTIYLDASNPLAGPAVTEDIVEVYPVASEKVAKVMMDDSEECVEAIIPYSMRSRFSDGIRDEDEEESVLIDIVDGDWTVVDRVAESGAVSEELVIETDAGSVGSLKAENQDGNSGLTLSGDTVYVDAGSRWEVQIDDGQAGRWSIRSAGGISDRGGFWIDNIDGGQAFYMTASGILLDPGSAGEMLYRTSDMGEGGLTAVNSVVTSLSFQGHKTGNVVSIYATFNWNGGTVTLPASGNIANYDLFRLPLRWRPWIKSPMASGNQGRIGSYMVDIDGWVSLTSLAGSSSLTNGDNLSLGGVFLVN